MKRLIMVLALASFPFLQASLVQPAFAGGCGVAKACNCANGSCCKEGECACAGSCCANGQCTCASAGCKVCGCKKS